jgi:AraC-like DNA-binding protein
VTQVVELAADGHVDRLIARGRLATISAHHHDPRARRHRDPDEEAFAGPTLVFSDGEPWHYEATVGAAEIDGRVVLAVEAGTPYRARHDRTRPEDRSLAVTFDTSAARGPVGDEAAGARLFATWRMPRTAALESMRLGLIRAALTAHRDGVLAVDLLTLELLTLVGSREQAARRDAEARDGRDRVAEGAAWLRRNLDDDIDLFALARATHTSPFHLSRLFRRHLGLPPIAYLRQLRLERAAQLLGEDASSVTEVCYAAGFGSLSHFVTAFRGAYGVTPGAYRRGTRPA